MGFGSSPAHQFVNPENLITMFTAAERFVGRHLGVARR